MAKTQQPELLLQSAMIGHHNDPKKGPCGLRGQGFYAEKQSERFKAGRPDLRVARNDVGQLDIELKYIEQSLFSGEPVDYGFTKLQWLHLKTMNERGIPAVGLIYFAKNNLFVLTVDRVLDPALPPPTHSVLKLPAPQIIDGRALVLEAKDYLHGIGYRHV